MSICCDWETTELCAKCDAEFEESLYRLSVNPTMSCLICYSIENLVNVGSYTMCKECKEFYVDKKGE